MRIPRWKENKTEEDLRLYISNNSDVEIIYFNSYKWYWSPSLQKSTGWFNYFYFFAVNTSINIGKVSLLREYNFFYKLTHMTLGDIYKTIKQ